MAADEVSRSSTRRAIVFLSVAAFAAASTTRVMDAILPQIAQEFQVSIGQVAFVATAYAFAYGAFQIVFGPLGDRFGKYQVVVCATLGSSVTTLLCAYVGSLEEIAVARLASGVMAAAIVPMSIAWVGDVAPSDERQEILARFLSGQILGLLAGQVSGGVFGEYLGWRSAFIFIGCVYLLSLAGLIFEMRRNPATRHVPSGNTMAQTLRNFVGLARRPVVRFVLLMVTVEAFAMFGAFTYVGASLRYRFSFDFATVGIFLATYCIGGLIYVWRSRRLIAFLGIRRLCFLGTVLVGFAYIAIALATAPWVCLLAIPVMGLGFYMLHNTLQTFSTEMAPDLRGSAVAIFATCYFLSQAVGVYLAGQVIDAYGTTPVFVAAAMILMVQGILLLNYIPAQLGRAARKTPA